MAVVTAMPVQVHGSKEWREFRFGKKAASLQPQEMRAFSCVITLLTVPVGKTVRD